MAKLFLMVVGKNYNSNLNEMIQKCSKIKKNFHYYLSALVCGAEFQLFFFDQDLRKSPEKAKLVSASATNISTIQPTKSLDYYHYGNGILY
jgi:hypothetical protein